MRRFLIGWILVVLLLPFAAAWIYSEWSEKNQQIEQESSQIQIDVQTVSGVQRMGTSDFLIGAIAGQIPAEFEVETLKAQAVMARSCLYKQAGDRYYISASDTGMTWCSETERKKMWGTSYKENNDRIRQAVRETDGQILYSARLVLYREWKDKKRERGMGRGNVVVSVSGKQLGYRESRV